MNHNHSPNLPPKGARLPSRGASPQATLHRQVLPAQAVQDIVMLPISPSTTVPLTSKVSQFVVYSVFGCVIVIDFQVCLSHDMRDNVSVPGPQNFTSEMSVLPETWHWPSLRVTPAHWLVPAAFSLADTSTVVCCPHTKPAATSARTKNNTVRDIIVAAGCEWPARKRNERLQWYGG